MSGEPVIAATGLSKDFGSGRGLFGLDLEVGRGEVFGFLGPNGAGKSTTMRLLLDLIRPTAGAARILGLDLEVRDGEVFGFLGPNGAGKSTTMRLLLDLIRPSSGAPRSWRASSRSSTTVTCPRVTSSR